MNKKTMIIVGVILAVIIVAGVVLGFVLNKGGKTETTTAATTVKDDVISLDGKMGEVSGQVYYTKDWEKADNVQEYNGSKIAKFKMTAPENWVFDANIFYNNDYKIGSVVRLIFGLKSEPYSNIEIGKAYGGTDKSKGTVYLEKDMKEIDGKKYYVIVTEDAQNNDKNKKDAFYIYQISDELYAQVMLVEDKDADLFDKTYIDILSTFEVVDVKNH